jgi:hypothetical protein
MEKQKTVFSWDSVHSLTSAPGETALLWNKHLYRATSNDFGGRIHNETCTRCGDEGIFRRGVSFADTLEAARDRTRDSDEVTIPADVNPGGALVLNGPSPDIIRATVREHGRDSVSAGPVRMRPGTMSSTNPRASRFNRSKANTSSIWWCVRLSRWVRDGAGR